MIEIHWLLFIAASLLLILTPGQDMLLVLSRSLTQGSAAGAFTAAGVSLGLVGHTLLATLGLGALLRSSAWLFTVLKVVGAAYLIWLGIQLLRQPAHVFGGAAPAPKSLRQLFVTGALSNVSNPKIAIFYFAFLPQFIEAGSDDPTLAIFLLGLAFAGLTALVKVPVGLTAGFLATRLRDNPGMLTWLQRTSGVMLIGLGLRLVNERPM